MSRVCYVISCGQSSRVSASSTTHILPLSLVSRKSVVLLSLSLPLCSLSLSRSPCSAATLGPRDSVTHNSFNEVYKLELLSGEEGYKSMSEDRERKEIDRHACVRSCCHESGGDAVEKSSAPRPSNCRCLLALRSEEEWQEKTRMPVTLLSNYSQRIKGRVLWRLIYHQTPALVMISSRCAFSVSHV